MKRKLVIIGVVSSILVLCLGALFMLGVLGWISLRPVEEKRPIKISILPPLPTPNAPNQLAAPGNGEQPGAPGPAAPVQGVLPSQQPEGSQAEPARLAVESNPAATDVEIEQTLGFALPAGSVNSVTQVGVASRLVIPRLGIDAPVVLAPIINQTWAVEQLGQAVGHLEGTSPPGAGSNIVLAGHVTLAETNGGPGPFYQLSQLVPGDQVFVYEGEAKYEYTIDGLQTVDRTAVEVTFPTDTPQLTLITCTRWDGNERRYVERLVARGHLN